LDTLQKHVGWKKTVIVFIGIVVGDWYKESTHVKNERLYVGRCIETIPKSIAVWCSFFI